MSNVQLRKRKENERKREESTIIHKYAQASIDYYGCISSNLSNHTIQVSSIVLCLILCACACVKGVRLCFHQSIMIIIIHSLHHQLKRFLSLFKKKQKSTVSHTPQRLFFGFPQERKKTSSPFQSETIESDQSFVFFPSTREQLRSIHLTQ